MDVRQESPMTERDPDLRLAIVDNSIHPEIYKPVAHWGRHLSVPFEAFTAREGRWPDPGRFTHLILTGSEASILEPDAWVEDEAGLVREAVGRGLAVLGSCWGHQLLALALAGPGHVARCPARRSAGSPSGFSGRATSSVRRGRSLRPFPCISTRSGTSPTTSTSWPPRPSARSRPSA